MCKGREPWRYKCCLMLERIYIALVVCYVGYEIITSQVRRYTPAIAMNAIRDGHV
jgi:hypothetical protein